MHWFYFASLGYWIGFVDGKQRGVSVSPVCNLPVSDGDVSVYPVTCGTPILG